MDCGMQEIFIIIYTSVPNVLYEDEWLAVIYILS